jgi:hypothetical protein
MPTPDPVVPAVPAAPAPFRQLVYRSAAVDPMAEADLHEMLVQARSRNEAERLTGLLVYHHGCFVQWLEGPADGLERVWRSIQADPRHTEVELLHTPWSGERLFPDWRMRLGSATLSEGEPDAVPLQTLALDALNRHGNLAHEFMRGIAYWRGLPAPEQMAMRLCRGSAADVQALREQVLAARPSLTALGWHVLGPVSRALGQLWNQDQLQGVELVLAQGWLQALVREVGGHASRGASRSKGRALVAPPPGEDHLAGATFAAVALDAAGWQVEFAFPRNDSELCGAVKARDFEVLHLALSGIFTRQERLARLASCIRTVRARTSRPLMQILVSGRAFIEQPGLAEVVGADGDGLAQGNESADLDAMLRWAHVRGWLPEAAAAQAALSAVAERLSQRLADDGTPSGSVESRD